MSVDVKICGLNDAASVVAAAQGGARYVGFVFYPKSPRFVSPEQAGALMAALPAAVTPVGLVVDATNDELTAILRTVPLRYLQLHGAETPARVADVKKLFGLPVLKALGVASASDLVPLPVYETVADMILLDAKPATGALSPGGNATAFDWGLLKDVRFAKPWMLSGGLNAANLATAVEKTLVHCVDVSSGVEDAPGRKNPHKISAFLELARRLETSY